MNDYDKHRENCSDFHCVNWSCDGTKHSDMSGKRWGSGWPEGVERFAKRTEIRKGNESGMNKNESK